MKNIKIDGWFNLFALFISASALVVSIKSCTDASNAIKISQNHYLQQNRPCLMVEPVAIEDTGRYFKIEKGKDINTVIFYLQYRITNIGNIIAKSIQFPSSASFKDNDMYPLESTPGPISLGPNQTINRIIYFIFKGTGNASEKDFIESYYSGESSIIHDFYVKYASELNPPRVYQTTVKYEIFNSHIKIIKSEMTAYDSEEKEGAH